MQNNNEYVINYTIPKGPTGNRGPIGKTGNKGNEGPMGQINSNEPLIFAKYHPKSENGMLELLKYFSIPENTDVFEIKDNYISLKKKGYYEFTVSGILHEENKNENTTFILRTQHQSNYNNSINIRIENNEKRKYFVSKKIQRFSYLQDISLLLNKTNISDANVQEVILIIQKLI